jgi:hypothetical protein
MSEPLYFRIYKYMDIVKEYINEKFEDDSDPIKDLGIGLTWQIQKWLDYYNIPQLSDSNNFKNACTINSDFTIDVYGSVNLNSCGLYKLPSYIKFNKINGDFMINHNNLKNMIGCPNEITHNFYVNGNPLKSLEGIPKKIKGLIIISKILGFSEIDIKHKCKVSEINYTDEPNIKVYNIKKDYHFNQRPGKLEDYVFESFTEYSNLIENLDIGIKAKLKIVTQNYWNGTAAWEYKNIKFFLDQLYQNKSYWTLYAYIFDKKFGLFIKKLLYRRPIPNKFMDRRYVENLWAISTDKIVKFILTYNY